MVKINEMFYAGKPLMEMSFRRKKAEQIVTGLEQPINLHLLKILAFKANEENISHWKSEIREWLLRIAIITLKPNNKHIPEKLVYEWLYDEPFGGNEISNMEMMITFLTRNYERNDVGIDEIKNYMGSFHRNLAKKVASGDPGFDLVEIISSGRAT